jgi:hypothetical protein
MVSFLSLLSLPFPRNGSQQFPLLMYLLSIKYLTTDSQTGGHLTFLIDRTQLTAAESESYVMTDGQSASLSWNKTPIWGLRPYFYHCQTVAGLLIWGAPSDEMTGLSFTTAACPRQRSHSRVRVPLDS